MFISVISEFSVSRSVQRPEPRYARKLGILPIVFFAAACVSKSDRSSAPGETASDSTIRADSDAAAKSASQDLIDSRFACAPGGFAARMWARDSSAGAGAVRNPETYKLQLRDYDIPPGPDRRPRLVRRTDVVSQTLTLLPDGTYRSEARLPITPGDSSKSKVFRRAGRFLKSPTGRVPASIVFTGAGGACAELHVIEQGTAFKGTGVPPARGGTGLLVMHIYRRSKQQE